MKFRALSLALTFVLAIGAVACGGDSTVDDSDKIVDDTEQERSEEAAAESDDDDSAPAEDVGESQSEDDIASISNDNEQANWTVLVYVMGDNDLEPFAVGDIFEMAEAGSNEHLNIVTLIDRHPGYADDEMGPLGNFEGTQLIHVGEEEILQSVDLGEVNTGSADELAGFVTAGIQQFPADHYALIIWDHGAGWPGMGPDETDGEDILTLPEMSEGITKGLEAAGVDRLDLIGFDACLMGTFEVAHAMRDLADVMLHQKNSNRVTVGISRHLKFSAVETTSPQPNSQQPLSTPTKRTPKTSEQRLTSRCPQSISPNSTNSMPRCKNLATSWSSLMVPHSQHLAPPGKTHLHSEIALIRRRQAMP